ncbi:integral membrane protein [Streptomyces sviceus ATCC 29083]|uniref:Integral membrane protein n=1 Tax=Streptomyces sviceus (strain ATCC 29083 / DSM 924 / JCM 4929 / NBRC 13980 / NCIMB 11184 / NRRL 5439 / UC 5370) TaxID=463191 RepID=D6XCS2_STRX2|nr:integral membrane protein [Streptomyces sviceus ATCC 29083]
MGVRGMAMVTRVGAGFTGGDGCAGSAAGAGVGMIDGPYFVLVVLGVLGTGLVAGVFCAFFDVS